MKKPESKRDIWKKRWYIGTPNGGGNTAVILGMDGQIMLGMDGQPIKPMEP